MSSLAARILLTGALAISFMGLAAFGQQTAPDNSKMNQVDRQQGQLNADQQSNASSDVKLTQEIRHSLVKDKSLSTYAHNVKIISQNGKVMLRGPVRSDDERNAIVAKAGQIAGQGNVTDEMTVAPSK